MKKNNNKSDKYNSNKNKYTERYLNNNYNNSNYSTGNSYSDFDNARSYGNGDYGNNQYNMRNGYEDNSYNTYSNIKDNYTEYDNSLRKNYEDSREIYNQRYNGQNINESSFNKDDYIENMDDEFEKDQKRNIKLFKAITTFIIIIVAMIAFFVVYSVSNKDKNKTTDKEETVASAEPTEDPHKGQARSMFTGLWIDESIVNNRPYAFMFNNIKDAFPQSGTSEMDILYEAVVEGGITRLMGISQNVTSDRIGSLRSARPYYVSIAKEYDALYVHIGGSDDAKKKISQLEVADFDGNSGIGNTLIYRDKSIKAPHNAFTSKERIDKVVDSKGYHKDYEGKKDNHFTFYDEVQSISGNGSASEKVNIELSGYAKPYFTYNKDEQLYYRYAFNTEHIDKNTNKQLAFTNIIIQYVKQWSYDSHDRQKMDIYDSTGDGVYISAGEYKDITWKRNEDKLTMQYLDNGELLKVNPGKTYIALVPIDRKSKTSIK